MSGLVGWWRQAAALGLSGTSRLAHHVLQSCGQGVTEAECDLGERRVSGPVVASLAEAVSGGAGLDNLCDRLGGGRAALPEEFLEQLSLVGVVGHASHRCTVGHAEAERPEGREVLHRGAYTGRIAAGARGAARYPSVSRR